MRYFEDYEVGETFTTGRRTITDGNISDFVELCGLYEPIFVDMVHLREATPYDTRFAPGEMTASFALGNVIRSGFVENAITMLDLEMDFEKPVFAGETIHVDVEVVETSETSDPGQGVVVFEYDVKNQDDESVMDMRETALIRARGNDGGGEEATE